MPKLNGIPFYADDLQPVMVRPLAYKRLQRLAKKLDYEVPVVIEVLLESYLDDEPQYPIYKEKKAIAKLKKLSTHSSVDE